MTEFDIANCAACGYSEERDAAELTRLRAEVETLKGPGNATQRQLDEATKPLHVEIETLKARNAEYQKEIELVETEYQADYEKVAAELERVRGELAIQDDANEILTERLSAATALADKRYVEFSLAIARAEKAERELKLWKPLHGGTPTNEFMQQLRAESAESQLREARGEIERLRARIKQLEYKPPCQHLNQRGWGGMSADGKKSQGHVYCDDCGATLFDSSDRTLTGGPTP